MLFAKLSRGCAPGCDGITAEHLLHGKSDLLCRHLSIAFSAILTYCVVPVVLRTGIIIPLLKKQTLDPNDTGTHLIQITLVQAYYP